jgi:antitoxin MazE
VRTTITRIGDAHGIRIPEPLLEACGIVDEVELKVEGGRLVIMPVVNPRAGWEQAFADADQGNEVFGEGVRNRFDEEEWAW